MRILVTGATGFIGQYLVEKLAKKNKVRALARKTSNVCFLKKVGVEVVYGDLRGRESLVAALDDIEAVYHLAAALPNSTFDKQVFGDINVGGTKNLISAAYEAASLKHFVHCSTAFIHWGKRPFANEGSAVSLDSVYVRSKFEGEKLVYSAIGKAPFKITVVRPGFVYGRHKAGLVPLLTALEKGRFFFVGNGEHLFEITHVDDLTRFLAMVLNNKRAFNQVFIVSQEKPLPFKDIVRIMCRELNTPFPSLSVPKPAFKIALKILMIVQKLSSIKIPFSEDSYKTFTLTRAFDATKARKMLDFTTKTTAEEGIKDLVKWYKNHNT